VTTEDGDEYEFKSERISDLVFEERKRQDDHNTDAEEDKDSNSCGK
jgi:hypothetical protein